MVLPVELTDIYRQLFFTTLLRSSPRWYILLILLYERFKALVQNHIPSHALEENLNDRFLRYLRGNHERGL